MIGLFSIVYISLVLVIYKLLRVRPTASNIAVVVSVGLVALGGIVITWKISAP
ncbi:MAG: HlyD family secretion protein, partial [Planctomycetaceae bacterium]